MQIKIERTKDIILAVLNAPSLEKADTEKLGAAQKLLGELLQIYGADLPTSQGNEAKDVRNLCDAVSKYLKSATPPFADSMQKFICGVLAFRTRLEEEVKGIDFTRKLASTIDDVLVAKGLGDACSDERIKSHIGDSVQHFRFDCETIPTVANDDIRQRHGDVLSIIMGANLPNAGRSLFSIVHGGKIPSRDDANEIATLMYDIVSGVGEKLGFTIPSDKVFVYKNAWTGELESQLKQ